MPLTAETKKEIFEKMKSIMQKQIPPLVISKNTDDNFELIGDKPVPYGSTKKIVPGMYFSSLLVRKDLISFHFFPMYINREVFIPLIPNMIKILSGKTCFNIKKLEQMNEKELSALFKRGIELFKELGYLK